MKKTIFFRNDDVRESIEDELLKLVDLFVAKNVPISLAVEPANVTKEVVDWLLYQKSKHPDIIELIQHGYDHNKRLLYPKGKEFGGERGFEDQFSDLKKGKEMMDTYFGNLWFPVMAFPYGSYNTPALQALDKLNYKGLTTGVDFSFKHRIKNLVGKITAKDFVYNKKVAYHNQIRKRYHFLELDASVNIIKKYLTIDTGTHFTLNEIMNMVENDFKHTDVIGILFHHRYHTHEFLMIEQLVQKLKEKGYQFSTFEKLHANFHKA
jgi:peptidoglycan/xylan/chitin deacetylase (PgdA/CDA1 family)